MKKILLIVAIILCPGCATTAKYNEFLETFVGKTGNELIDRFGYPDRKGTFESQEYWVYEKQQIRPKPFFPAPFASPVYVGTSYQCTTTFVLEYGIVARWQHNGNDCTIR